MKIKPDRDSRRLLAKRVTRLNTIQALFQMEATKQGLDSIIWEFLECGSGRNIGSTRLEKPLNKMFCDLLQAALDNQLTIDKSINRHLAEDWELARMDPTLRALLRVAAAENLSSKLPVDIVRNEYVEIAKGFYPETEQIGFVNAILTKIFQHEKPLSN